MPRSNRQRPSRAASRGTHEEIDLAKALQARRHTESRRDALWNVHPISAVGAVKAYVCPGCGGVIGAGTAHVVAWRADGLLGEADDVAARRHWHSHCWAIG